MDFLPYGVIVVYQPTYVRINECAFRNSNTSGVVLIADDLHQGSERSFVLEETSFYGNGRIGI